ncbi:PAH-inducible cytochrome P450 monooxygenase PC-PAH 1 [Irpex rosettiformis]|uniref:PAH-inducible cytochrome P450 monooxygenase PC-PAH 1 n=1 Tax=Irpex rosettiformis TaxID=378272 RepID=A0ACB8U474_9APHY|nr:PAH-inducible cytochrome P450 monooxygenase PC-PAH 1 [Irpex rosettiformis]
MLSLPIANLTASNASLALLLLLAAYAAYRRLTRPSVKNIRGPEAPFWLGNDRDFIRQTNVGDLDFRCAQEYGNVWRMGGVFGRDILLVADPKALQHILQKSGYNYPKDIVSSHFVRLFAGDSILYAPTGKEHVRHRKVMNPAFSAPQLRSFLPQFRDTALKLCRLWKDQILEGKVDGDIIPVNKWLARTTLDIVGETAYHFDFGALDNSKNEVSEAYARLFAEAPSEPVVWVDLFAATWRWLPRWLLELIEYIPVDALQRLRRSRLVMNKVSTVLVDNAMEDAQTVEIEKGRKDVVSVLVRANLSENPSLQLSKHEMVSQMAALTIAGHETTANTLSWLLWELAKHPHLQERLRGEIKQKRQEVIDRVGERVDFSLEDLESMTFLQALLKEILRFHPIIYQIVREAGKDDILPLSSPITTTTGEAINEVPIAKGQVIVISICTYNRIKSIWGEDAHEFNPSRFLDGKLENEVKVGMYANLMTFSAGMRGCIGWKFSLIEMQAILVALIENFEFSLPPTNDEILRRPIGAMSPMVEGRQNEGVLLPLMVRAIDNSV